MKGTIQKWLMVILLASTLASATASASATATASATASASATATATATAKKLVTSNSKSDVEQNKNVKNLRNHNHHNDQIMIHELERKLQQPMPMHRHFLLHQQQILLSQLSQSTGTKNQQYNHRSTTTSSRDDDDDLTTNKLSNSFYNNANNHKYNYDDNNNNNKNDKYNPYNNQYLALQASWWFRFQESVNRPETRRSHHSVLYSFDVDTSVSNENGDGASNSNENGNSVGNDKVNQDNSKEENNVTYNSISPTTTTSISSIPPTISPTIKEPIINDDNIEINTNTNNDDNKFNNLNKEENTTSSTLSPLPLPSYSPTTTNTNTNTNTKNNHDNNRVLKNNHNHHTKNKTPSSFSSSTKTQEYMIISGGFTDFDWHTFPVWAYDISSAVENNNGKWHEITKTTKLTSTQPEDMKKEEELLELCRSNNGSDGRSTSTSSFSGNAVGNNDNNNNNMNNQDLWKSSSLLCSPPSRVGHISIMRNEYLYIFGGFLYNDKQGVFYMEQEPYMYRMKIPSDYFSNPTQYDDNASTTGVDTDTSTSSYENVMDWERIVPNVMSPPPSMQTTNNQKEYTRPEDIINRGEVRGGYWEKGDKLIIYGGLHVRDYVTLYNHEQQADETLGDVWAYDFQTDTWEMLAPSWAATGNVQSSNNSSSSSGSSGRRNDHPGERTSHSATVVGDELVIYGGLKKVETYLWDGSTVWDQLDDVWVFDLNTLKWTERDMKESIGRAYQSLIGWQSEDRVGTVIAAFGGFKTVTDPVDNQQISYVYGDTLLSFPSEKSIESNETDPSIWFVAAYEGTPMQMSTRLEHTAVLSKAYGNMIVWGGRYRGTSEIEGIWSLNVHGENSNVLYMVRSEEDETPDIGAAYVILVTVMLMSMMFTYMCGVLQRHIERNEGGRINIDQVMDPSNGFGFTRRNGLRQEIIDTLPLKTYSPQVDAEHLSSFPSEDSEAEGEGENRRELQHDQSNCNISNTSASSSSDQNDYSYDAEDDDENCCPICLVEYCHGDEIRGLPCEHEFHKACVDPWLTNNASCPACRHSMQDLVVLSASSASQADNAGDHNDDNDRSGDTGREGRRSGRRLSTATSFLLPRFLLRRIVQSSSRQRQRQHSATTVTAVTSSSSRSHTNTTATTAATTTTTASRSQPQLHTHHLYSGNHSSNETDDTLGDLELSLSYSSSMELNDHLPPERNGRRGRRFRPVEFGDNDGVGDGASGVEDENELQFPIHGRSRRMRVVGSANRQQRTAMNTRGRLNGRRRRGRGTGARSPLNDPLQPSDGTMA
jgi:hypothetical protein